MTLPVKFEEIRDTSDLLNVYTRVLRDSIDVTAEWSDNAHQRLEQPLAPNLSNSLFILVPIVFEYTSFPSQVL